MTDKPEPQQQAGSNAGIPLSNVVRFWLPLATSWLLMALEWPLVTGAVARMPDTKLQLAALGIAMGLSMSVQSPIIPLLTTTNVLARESGSFRLLNRFTRVLIAGVTATVILISLTPLFELLVVHFIGAPAELVSRARPAFWALTVWPAAIGYRRFCQGVIIRYGYTRPVGYGTGVRLVTSLGVLLLGLAWGKLDGAVLGGLALSTSATAEAAYIRYKARPAFEKLRATQPTGSRPSLTLGSLLRFYAPLALTYTISLSTAPLINFGLARSPYPIESLAAWPVVDSQLFVLRSIGISLQEVVVALLNGPSTLKTLRRFAGILGVASLVIMLSFAFTPLSLWWQQSVAGLSPDLAAFARQALQRAALLPLLAVTLSLLRGIVLSVKATKVMAQATVLNLTVLITVILVGVNLAWLPGASLAAISLTLAQSSEIAWLWRRARPVQQEIAEQASWLPVPSP